MNTNHEPPAIQPVAFSGLADLQQAQGEPIGASGWITVTQLMIDGFAELTSDRQWIHVDPERARRESPLQTTIAHGFLTLSLLSSMIAECISFPTARAGYNYGFDKVRFVAPVPVNAQIRGVFAIEHVRPIAGGADITWRAVVEVRDAPKPALVATWLTRTLFRDGPPE
jgi:acyl dehydratase